MIMHVELSDACHKLTIGVLHTFLYTKPTGGPDPSCVVPPLNPVIYQEQALVH
jgi:hypothetical protein